MSDNDATLVRHSVAEDADEIIEHIINANMLSMPYDVYSELFDAVDGLGVEIEKLQSENAKLRELVLCLLTCSSDTGDACDKCPVNGGSGIWEFEDFCDSLLDRVHELRIEVDE